MTDEDALLAAVRANRLAQTPRLVYADWLDDHDQPDRAAFVRLHLTLSGTAPDHADRVAAEHELSRLRKSCDPSFLAVIEPESPAALADPAEARGCQCFAAGYGNRKWPTPYFHLDAQDTECDAWKRLLDRVEEAAADGREEFAPLRDMSAADRARIVTLPASVAKLKAVRTLHLYGSCLVRLPPEVGEMTALEEFVPYTSYRLHWFPFELTRCPVLRGSTVSTRALYGNYKYRPPFPLLGPEAEVAPGRVEPVRLPPSAPQTAPVRPCSVCGRPFEDRREHRVWVSLGVATDVLPLLVNACSASCVNALPKPPAEYIPKAHRGGRRVPQPRRE